MNNVELYSIVRSGDLFNELDIHLKSASNVNEILQRFYQIDGQNVTLLMLAALHGHDRVVRTLLSHSSNMKRLVELVGYVIDINGNPVVQATALWCACNRGHYTVARILIETSIASVNGGPNNPLLIDAVIHQRFDTIQFLIENNYVNIDQAKERNEPYYNSLMLSSSRGYRQIVAYLLDKGADIEFYSAKYDTALGCAAMHGHLDIVKLLCLKGAKLDLKNQDEQTPLILAFENGHSHIVNYLLSITNQELSIDELELIACSFIVTKRINNYSQVHFERMINLIKKIFQLRKDKQYPKIVAEPIIAYNFHRECRTIEEFEQIEQNNDRLFIEALLIRERIMFPQKSSKLCEPLLCYGQKLIEQGNFEYCLHLWEHTFHLYQNMGHDTSLHRFVWLFCKMLTANIFISPELFVKICRLTFEPAEQTKKNHSIKNALCFVTIAAKILEQSILTKNERRLICQWIFDLCRQQRTTSDGQTLLHLCVNDQTYRDINYRANEIKQVLNFPNFITAQLLLYVGGRSININAVDLTNGDTALHIVSRSTKSDALPIVELLLNAGAHIDCLNKHGKTPIDDVKTSEIKVLLQKQEKPALLKCLCARYIVLQDLNYELKWSSESKLNHFIYLHGVLSKQNHT